MWQLDIQDAVLVPATLQEGATVTELVTVSVIVVQILIRYVQVHGILHMCM